MSGIEFTSNPGKTFLVSVRNPASGYVLLASGIACTEITSTRYRASLGSLTGLVWIEAAAGATKTVGFADLDAPSANGYSDVVDEMTGLQAVSNQIDSINTDIAGEVVTALSAVEPRVVSQYDPRKRHLALVQSDDYNFTSKTHIDMAINLPAGVDANACTVLFSAVHQEQSASRLDLTLSLASLAGKYFVRFQATASQMSVASGLYDWQAVVKETAGGRRVTVISGIADIAKAVVAVA